MKKMLLVVLMVLVLGGQAFGQAISSSQLDDMDFKNAKLNTYFHTQIKPDLYTCISSTEKRQVSNEVKSACDRAFEKSNAIKGESKAENVVKFLVIDANVQFYNMAGQRAARQGKEKILDYCINRIKYLTSIAPEGWE